MGWRISPQCRRTGGGGGRAPAFVRPRPEDPLGGVEGQSPSGAAPCQMNKRARMFAAIDYPSPLRRSAVPNEQSTPPFAAIYYFIFSGFR